MEENLFIFNFIAFFEILPVFKTVTNPSLSARKRRSTV